MNTLQTWIIIGAPGLALAAGLFVGNSPTRASFGYVALGVVFASFVTIPGDIVSALIVGAIGFFLLAAGRGFEPTGSPEHHETRTKWTRSGPEGL